MRQVLFLLIALPLLAGEALAQLASDTPQSDAEPLVSTADVERLSVPRGEAEDDRVTAKALIASARMFEQRRDNLATLRRYQRAYRYDPSREYLLKEIISLAMEAKRPEEASRYAALADDGVLKDLLVLRRLAVDASSRRDWPLAAKFYEASLRKQEASEDREATYVLLKAELGRVYFLQGKNEESHQAFAVVRKALKSPEDFNLSESLLKIVVSEPKETNSIMARVALESGHYDEALELYAAVHKDDPESTSHLIDQARIAVAREDWVAAEALLAKVFERGDFDSKVPTDLLRRMLSKQLGEEKVAAATFEKLSPVLAVHPRNAAVRFAVAQAAIAREDFAAAENTLTDPALEKPSDELQRLLLVVRRLQNDPAEWLRLGGEWVQSGTIGVMAEEITEAAANETFTKSLIAAADAVKAQPVTPASLAMNRIAANVALEAKQYDISNRLFNAGLPDEAEIKGELLIGWGLKCLQADQYDASAAALKRVVDEKLLAKERPGIYFYLSAAYVLAKQGDQALAAARKAAELSPRDPRFFAREAWTLYHLKRDAEAKEKYDAFIAKFDKSTDAEARSVLREARLLTSTMAAKLGNMEEGIERLEQVLDEYPSDIGAGNDLAYLWSERGEHLDRSLRMAEKAVAAEPENRAYRDTLGWILFRLERYPEAVAELENAAAAKGADGVILDHLGDAYAKIGKPQEAKSIWQRAADAYLYDGNAVKATAIEAKLRSPTP